MARLSRSIGAGLTLCVLGTLMLAAPASTAVRSAIVRSDGDGHAEEQQFIDKINALRSSKGLNTLAVDVELTTQARIWSQTMKDAGKIYHSSDLSAGVSADWQKLGENVGVGGTVDALFDAFVASPKHYENLVDPAYRFIGIGVVWDGSRMFTAHRFMAVFPSPSTSTAKAPSATAPRAPKRPAPTTAPKPKAPQPPPTTTTVPSALSASDAPPVETPTTATPAALTARPADASRLRAEIDALDEYLR